MEQIVDAGHGEVSVANPEDFAKQITSVVVGLYREWNQ